MAYDKNFFNKIDADYESNRSKMWYISLRKALIVLKSDLTTKSTKLNDLDESIGRLKNPAYGLLLEIANEKMRDATRRLQDFFVLFEDYNKLTQICETLSTVTDSEKTEKKLSSPKQPPQLPPPVPVQSQPSQEHPQNQPQQQLIQSHQQLQPPQQPSSSFNPLSLTPRTIHGQSPLSTPIRSFLEQTTDLFEEIRTPDKSLVPSSPFSAEFKSFTTPSRILGHDSPPTASLSTPVATYYSNSYVVKDLMKDLKTPEKKQVPPSPLSVVIASSGIGDRLSPVQAATPIFVSETSTTTTTATISTHSSPTLPTVNLPRGVLRSKRVSLEKFQQYNSIGMKRRAESAPILARQRQQRKLLPKKIVEITKSSSSSTQNPMTTQLLKNINVDQFLSKVHDKK